MNAHLLRMFFGACSLAGAAMPLLAVPLQRSDVPAAPAWVVHVDCDKLRPTAMGQYLLAEMEKPEAREQLAALWSPLRFDPRKQLHGLTLYSRANAPEEKVLLVYADFEAERLIRLARGARDYQTTPYKKHLIHNWIGENSKSKQAAGRRVYAAMQADRVVVLGRREPDVARALDVLDRAAGSLAGSSQFTQLGARSSGVFLQAAVSKVDLPPLNPAGAIFRLAKAGRLEVGETAGRLGATLNLEANDEAAAAQMLSASQALLALLRLQPGNASAARLAEGFILKQQGAEVVATLAVSTGDAIELMKSGGGRTEQKKAEGQ